MITFESQSDKKNLKIKLTSEKGKLYNSKEKEINLIIHNVATKPSKVKVGGEKVAINWNAKTKILKMPVVWKTKTSKKINIKF